MSPVVAPPAVVFALPPALAGSLAALADRHGALEGKLRTVAAEIDALVEPYLGTEEGCSAVLAALGGLPLAARVRRVRMRLRDAAEAGG